MLILIRAHICMIKSSTSTKVLEFQQAFSYAKHKQVDR